ncbi:MAG: lipid II flippase MurJ, partial [Desulfobacterales bacterium CG23_combo_of_CG06-09_8_20_14_all_51_8]
IIFSLILMGPLAHGGLALAASIASMINFLLLAAALKIKLGALGGKKIIESVARSVLCSLVMGGCLLALTGFYHPADPAARAGQMGIVAGAVLLGVGVYITTAWFLKCRELEDIMNLFRKKGPFLP